MQENQQFTSLDTLSVFGLMAGILTLITALVSNAMVDHRISTARVHADRIATQMVFGDFGPNGDKTRGPASLAKAKLGEEGKIGQDPWGNPFQYRILNDTQGRFVAVVTSLGANGAMDTLPEDLRLDDNGLYRGVTPRGDDVISIQKSAP